MKNWNSQAALCADFVSIHLPIKDAVLLLIYGYFHIRNS